MGFFDFLFGKKSKVEPGADLSVLKKEDEEPQIIKPKLTYPPVKDPTKANPPKNTTDILERDYDFIIQNLEKHKKVEDTIPTETPINEKEEDILVLTSLRNSNLRTTNFGKSPTYSKSILDKPKKATKPVLENNKFDFVAIDFEISDNNHSICSAAIVAVKDGIVVEEKEWLIKPSSSHFEIRNTRIHGISYDMVKNSPTFPEVWNELKHYVENELIVAHNILGTEIFSLKKAFEEYKISPVPSLSNYVCTLQLSRALLPDLENHKLTTLIEHFELSKFKHHDALEDSRACANLYLKLKTSENFEAIINKSLSKKGSSKKAYFQSQHEEADKSLIKITNSDELNIESFNEKNIVITGVFNVWERDSLAQKFEELGANIRSSVNSKTGFLIVGEEPGPSKIAQASALGIPMLSEEELLKIFN